MEKQANSPEEFVSREAESFPVEFLNSRHPEIVDAMSKIGNFRFRQSGSLNEGEVCFEGERADGTVIKISIKKGDGYRSPAEIAAAEKEAENAG